MLYDFCTELLQNRSVSDATYARAVAKFGEQGILDAIGLMGHYSLIGMVLNTARTPVAPGGPPLLERFPRQNCRTAPINGAEMEFEFKVHPMSVRDSV